jgi:hypothetical protein
VTALAAWASSGNRGAARSPGRSSHRSKGKVVSFGGSPQLRLFRLKRPAPLVPFSGGFAHGFPAFFGDPMKVLAAVLDAPKGRQDAAPLARRAFLGPGPALAGFLS